MSTQPLEDSFDVVGVGGDDGVDLLDGTELNITSKVRNIASKE